MAYSYKALCELLNCRQATSLKRTMTKLGIRWRLDRTAKPWTTEEELNRAFGPKPNTQFTFTAPPDRRNRKAPSEARSRARTDAGTMK
jgi:hypothetical protein